MNSTPYYVFDTDEFAKRAAMIKATKPIFRKVPAKPPTEKKLVETLQGWLKICQKPANMVLRSGIQNAATKNTTPTKANSSFRKLLSDIFLILFITFPPKCKNGQSSCTKLNCPDGRHKIPTLHRSDLRNPSVM